MLDKNSHQFQIFKNYIDKNVNNGINIKQSNNNNITSNQIYNNRNGMTISGSYNNSITNNEIINSSFNGILLNSNSRENVLNLNNIYNSNNNGIYIKDTNTNNNIIIENTITNGSNYGIQLFETSKNIMKNNFIYSNKKADYYSKFANFNLIKDTEFKNTKLRFFDNSSNFIISNSDNKLFYTNHQNSYKIYKNNITATIYPIYKNFTLNNIETYIIPDSGYINIPNFKLNNDNKINKLDLEFSKNNINTKFIIGNLAQMSQFIIKDNSKFQEIHISNSTGFLEFDFNNNNESKKVVFLEKSNESIFILIIVLILVIIFSVLFLIIKLKRRQKNKSDDSDDNSP